MEDDVSDNNESAEHRNDQGDKIEVPDPSPHPSHPVKRPRGRPKKKYRSLGSLISIPDLDKMRKPPKKTSNVKKIFMWGLQR